ncbi:hypothetical protein [uncultured Methanobrevibacter sp.]|uniref:hypothetical protein n=1 Tax=uncultured Methanobrevibacter sp. TaxID=253161 RepID=UPI003208560F
MPEIPHEEDIIRIMSLAREKRDKAIITLILSSGMQPRFIRNLTFNQVLQACDHFFKDDEPKTMENLLKRDPMNANLIACFNIGTANSCRMTCCTPEALSLLFQYIYYRPKNGDGDKVFLNNNGTVLTKNYVSDTLAKLCKEIPGYGDYEVPEITASSLRNRFTYICAKYLEEPNKDNVITLMNGGKSVRNQNFYEAVLNDKQILIGNYKSIVDCLSLSKAGNRIKNTNATTDFSLNLF